MLPTLALVSALALGQQATVTLPKTTVFDLSGQAMVLPVAEAKATVLMFVAVDCPISNRYAPEYVRIIDAYSPKGVAFVRVYLDDSIPKEDIVKHGKDFKLSTPAFLDPKLSVVKLLGITVTPEMAVLGPNGRMLYRGRLNDLFADHGRLREGNVRQDLRVALDEILAGKPVSMPFTTAIGCGIPEG